MPSSGSGWHRTLVHVRTMLRGNWVEMPCYQDIPVLDNTRQRLPWLPSTNRLCGDTLRREDPGREQNSVRL